MDASEKTRKTMELGKTYKWLPILPLKFISKKNNLKHRKID